MSTPESRQPQKLLPGTALLPRLLLALALGLVFAAFLTWFMYVLIQSGEQRLDESERIVFTDFIQSQRNEQTRTRERLPEKPVVSEAPPAPQSAQTSDAMEGESMAIADMSIDADIGEMNTELGFGSGDGEYLPIVKVAPIYPIRAQSKGLEGTCLVSYTVTPAGTVENVVVIESACSDSVFYKPSIDAALKFRYKPRVIDGEAMAVHGVKNMFTYMLQRN